MKRFVTLLTMVCFLWGATNHAASATTYATHGDAQNRFKDGAHLVAPDLEYISAASSTTFKVMYNLYLHVNLYKAMEDTNPFSDEHVKAEKVLQDEGKKICDRNKNADVCTIYYWVNLASIPTINEMNESNLEQARGTYVREKGRNGSFNWRSSASNATLPRSSEVPADVNNIPPPTVKDVQ